MKKCKSNEETGGQEGIQKIHDSTITELKNILCILRESQEMIRERLKMDTQNLKEMMRLSLEI